MEVINMFLGGRMTTNTIDLSNLLQQSLKSIQGWELLIDLGFKPV